MKATPKSMSRDHGGNLDAALREFGGEIADWVDLSTGINPIAYPVPEISQNTWCALPRKSDMQRLIAMAQNAYDTQAQIAAFAGAQGAIQAIPFLRPPGKARVISPTYNEHAGALRAVGWNVEEVATPDALAGAELAIVVNPNNPDGRSYAPQELMALAKTVGLLVVDESFADPVPELSLAPQLHGIANVLVLRSFGKFYGLAGVRLGFALGSDALVARLRELAGPWPISGPAIAIACAALGDTSWQRDTILRLGTDAARLDQLAQRAGWAFVGGTPLFRTYATPDAAAAQRVLATHQIWSRIFPYSRKWIRLGLPGSGTDWARLEACVATVAND